jgi:hypothetical protein
MKRSGKSCPDNQLLRSGDFAMVEVEHSTESLPALYSTSAIDPDTRTLQQPILQPVLSKNSVVRPLLDDRS